MSERMTTCNVAYRKGVQAGQSGERFPQCPYDIKVKKELARWWFNGLNDWANGEVKAEYMGESCVY